jgi:hypothetical protein
VFWGCHAVLRYQKEKKKQKTKGDLNNFQRFYMVQSFVAVFP